MKLKRKFKTGWRWVKSCHENWLTGGYVWAPTDMESEARMFADFATANFVASCSERPCEIVG